MGSPPQDDCSHEFNSVRSRVDDSLIGSRWKCSDVCSRGVLTDRGLDLFVFVALQSSVFLFFHNHLIPPDGVASAGIMGKPLVIEPHLSVEELESHYRQASAPIERTRYQILSSPVAPGLILALDSGLWNGHKVADRIY